MLSEKIKSQLNKLNNLQLAYFAKYKLTTYLNETQANILSYIQNERKLTLNELNKLIEKDTNSKKDKMCTKCGSNFPFTYEVEYQIPYWSRFRRYYVINAYEENNVEKLPKTECFVCGNILIDPNLENRSFFYRFLKKLFNQKYIL